MDKTHFKTDTAFKGGLKFTVFATSVIILSAFISVIFANADAAVKISVSQVPCLVGAGIVFYMNRMDKTETFGIFKPRAKFLFLNILLFAGVFFGLSSLNSIVTGFFSEVFGYTAKSAEFPEFSVVTFMLITVSYCVIPAVCEEYVFRKTLISSLKGNNAFLTALSTGALFSVYHMNPAQTAYQFAVGFLFGYSALKSGSFVYTAAAHFLNNFTIISLYYAIPQFTGFKGVWGAAAVFGGLAAIAAFFIFTAKTGESESVSAGKPSVFKFFKGAFIGAAACATLWIAVFASGI